MKLAAWLSIATLLLCSQLVCSQRVSAALVAYESFSYSAGAQLNGQAGGFGFSTPWQPGAFNAGVTNAYTISSSSISVGLPNAGGSMTSNPQTALAGLVRNLSSPLGAANTTVYMSFLARPESTFSGTFNNFFGITLETPTDPELFIGRTGASNQWAMENRGGGGLATTGELAFPSAPYALVLKAEFFAGLDRFTLYVNPIHNGIEPLTGTVKQDINLPSITGIGIYSTGGFSIDEIKVGTTYQSVTVVPEPSMLLAGLVAAAGCSFLRSRRQR